LTDVGGKSLFTKEIEEALLTGTIDLAVHSMKDVSAEVPEGLVFPAILQREDPRDALITSGGRLLEEFPKGAFFGTSSLRRQAYILSKYPHFQTTSLRGNVATRLEKVDKGKIDATLLAVAGLKRLGLLEKATKILDLEEFLPAIAQGAIGIQARKDDQVTLDLLAPLNHLPTFHAVNAERAFMKVLQGSCRTPMAAHAYVNKEILMFKGMVCNPDGSQMRFTSRNGPVSQALLIGQEAALELKE